MHISILKTFPKLPERVAKVDSAFSPTDGKTTILLEGGRAGYSARCRRLWQHPPPAAVGQRRLGSGPEVPVPSAEDPGPPAHQGSAHWGLRAAMPREATKLTFSRITATPRAGSRRPGTTATAGYRTRGARPAGPAEAERVEGKAGGLPGAGGTEPCGAPGAQDRKHRFHRGHGGPGPSFQKCQPRSPATRVTPRPQPPETRPAGSQQSREPGAGHGQAAEAWAPCPLSFLCALLPEDCGFRAAAQGTVLGWTSRVKWNGWRSLTAA